MLKFSRGWPLLLLLLTILSCNRSAVSGEVLSGENLFSLNIGMLEDEIDFFHRGATLPQGKNSIFMYQGIIFIGNSPGLKVMEFSSYGDLISLVYNDDENPRPLLLSSQSNDGKVVNRRAYPFPFRNIGDIAVSSDHVLLVEDRVSAERADFDQETGAILEHIIHRFAADGSYLDYIGQEGIGGTPFPFIISMELTARDDLVVLARNQNSHNVFWYNRDGERLFTVNIDEAHLPAGRSPGDFPSLAGIFPDVNEYRLYLHINFETSEPGVIDSRVYLLELPEGRYTGSFELTRNIQPLPSEEGMEYIEYPYQFIGAAENGNLFFFISRNNAFEHSLIILDSTGNLKARRILRVENPDLFFSDYQVSREGIITALLGDPDSADVYWWRVDRILGLRGAVPRTNGGGL